MTNKQLYDSYCDDSITSALRADRLKTLKQRANYGDRNAAYYVRLIEACSK